VGRGLYIQVSYRDIKEGVRGGIAKGRAGRAGRAVHRGVSLVYGLREKSYIEAEGGKSSSSLLLLTFPSSLPVSSPFPTHPGQTHPRPNTQTQDAMMGEDTLESRNQIPRN